MIKHIFYSLLVAQLFYCKQTDNKISEKKNSFSGKSQERSVHISGDTIKGDFNADKIQDYIESNSMSVNEKRIKIFLGKSNHKFIEAKSFTITDDNFSEVENPIENFFISRGKLGEIIFGASCCGNFKTTETYFYKFLNNNWFLYKTTVSTVDDDFLPNISLELNDLSQSIDGENVNNKDAYNKEIESLKKYSLSRFNQIYTAFKINYKNKSLEKLNSIDFDEITEMLYFNPISENNVNIYNDLAYYNSFTNNGNQNSVLLLKKIIEKFPDRVVAYLNLGDAYWSINNKEYAKDAYTKYIELMKSQNKDLSKIPSRIEERLD